MTTVRWPKEQIKGPRRPLLSEPPLGGRQKGVTPICSDFPFCSRFVPDLRSLFLGIPRFVPNCSDSFRFVFRTNQGNPLLPTPFASPRFFRHRIKNADGLVQRGLEVRSQKDTKKAMSDVKMRFWASLQVEHEAAT